MKRIYSYNNNYLYKNKINKSKKKQIIKRKKTPNKTAAIDSNRFQRPQRLIINPQKRNSKHRISRSRWK